MSTPRLSHPHGDVFASALISASLWSRYRSESAENSISAMLSQLPCLGGSKFQFFQNCIGFFGREGVVQRARLMGVQIVHDDPNPAGLRVGLCDTLHRLGKFELGSMFGDPGLAPARERLAKKQNLGDPMTAYSVSSLAG